MASTAKGLCPLILASLLGLSIASPLYFEDFTKPDWEKNFVKSSDPKYNGELVVEVPQGLDQPAIKVPEKARYYGYASNVGKPIDPSKGLVLQYELKLAEGLSCGGAYLKFLTASAELDASGLVEETPYVVMFGPDKCGATNKIHLIIKHRAPNGDIEEKHLTAPPPVPSDSKTHVLTAVLEPSDNTYEVLIDGEVVKSGSLLEDFTPGFNPPEEIDDPEASKPSDWVDAAKIADPEAEKPDDWDEDAPAQIDDAEAEKPEGWLDDEPAEVDDPEASKPDDWDEEEDGEWEPPKVANPKCTSGPGCGDWKRPKIPNPDFKGKWSAPFIDNPNYKGPWSPPKIANPKYFVDETPLKNIGKVGGVALEIWTMDSDYYFGNILVDNDASVAEKYRKSHWEPKKAIEEKLEEEKKAKEPKLDADDSETSSPVLRLIRSSINSIFDLPILSILRDPLEPLLNLVEDNDIAAIIAAAALLAPPLFFLLLALGPNGKAKKAARKAQTEAKKIIENKKEDKSTVDDKPVVASATTTSEITEEDDDEDEGKKVTKRKVRREA